MTIHKSLGLMALGIAASVWGCASTGRSGGDRSSTSASSNRPAAEVAPATAETNPTSRAGRGDPSLDDFSRPAAWLYIDGHAGKFREADGKPSVPWFIDEPVGPSPRVNLVAYRPLLGEPTEVSFVLSRVKADDGPNVSYAIHGEPGAYRAGRNLSLLNPGPGFVIRNRTTGDVVTEIAALPAGTYLLAAVVKNGKSGREGLAMSEFTVAGDE